MKGKIVSMMFLGTMMIAAVLAGEGEWPPFEPSKPERVTAGPKYHFFGYYGITPWDSTGRYILCLETDFQDRMPKKDEAATVGIVDMERNREFIPLSKTLAWNFQQGAFQQWLPSAPDRKIIYNDRDNGRFISVIMDIVTGEKRKLPIAVSSVSPDGRSALGINFARLSRLHPVIGYVGGADPTAGVPQPDDDGVFKVDLETGETKLIVSIVDVVRAYKGPADLRGKTLWLSLTGYNPSGARFLFLARYARGPGMFDTAMFTADSDGGRNLRCIGEFGSGISHFAWVNDSKIFVTMDPDGKGHGSSYVFMTDGAKGYELFGNEVLTRDGHPSFSPGGRWLLTDTYPDETMRQSLYLIDMTDGRHLTLGRFKHPARFLDTVRCDLHPRWNRDGTMVSFDSVDGNSRQVYIIQLTDKVLK